MKVATLSVMDHHPSLGRSVPTFYKEILEQIEAAEAHGFHSAWFAEHHFSHYGSCPSAGVISGSGAAHQASATWCCCKRPAVSQSVRDR